jgi:hypothetical protein
MASTQLLHNMSWLLNAGHKSSLSRANRDAMNKFTSNDLRLVLTTFLVEVSRLVEVSLLVEKKSFYSRSETAQHYLSA